MEREIIINLTVMGWDERRELKQGDTADGAREANFSFWLHSIYFM